MMTLAVVSFQWFFWGFSLAFSETGSAFIGDLKYFALRGVVEKPSIGSTRIPSIVFCVYQLMFAAITPMLAVGAIAERARLGPTLAFVFIWSTLVYGMKWCHSERELLTETIYRPHRVLDLELERLVLQDGRS
jgi:ammonium transporter, Amt family